ncbi:tRNA (adenosine(37)-N6)-threonylcarbamoyltransferase complex dimerization subunit type 1 TsaB [Vogesella oryzae]|uniref:tRNA (adenosine(37)-N6)-threonylcarbamoyltransferase complex dimerization subunit type 1 TsaB n=1 Tax=Vogesella oryzae TaxID=1735285 RepID=UPI001581AA67|nr:tRNA (adenosine(37)-N6)-threonylcarbamoyltransferase complex dimerization subunit type 1 TsaB [Vogesella oryzae]
MTHLLALDCSNYNLSVALLSEQRLYRYHQTVKQGHSDLALSVIADLLQQANIALQQLDAILFGKGPGAFTGLRIAAGIVTGLGTAAAIPVHGICTLDAIALNLPQESGIAVLDARMQEVYVARYQNGQAANISVCSPAQLQLQPEDVLAGDAANLFSDLPQRFISCEPLAENYIQLFQRSPERYPRSDSADLLYVRDKVALTTAEQQEQHRA